MFCGCWSLEKLDISGWDTSNVTSMYAMFFYCKSLEYLDVSSWDTSKVTDIGCIFNGCKKSIIPNWYKAKKKLTESKFNFNPVDYSDDDSEMISRDTLNDML
jgi:surface protein